MGKAIGGGNMRSQAARATTTATTVVLERARQQINEVDRIAKKMQEVGPTDQYQAEQIKELSKELKTLQRYLSPLLPRVAVAIGVILGLSIIVSPILLVKFAIVKIAVALKLDSTVVAAIIGFAGTIGAAIIGLRKGQQRGYQSGFEEGSRKDSILIFMDDLSDQFNGANQAILNKDGRGVRQHGQAIVNSIKDQRELQETFTKLLNSQVDHLEKYLEQGNSAAIEDSIRTLIDGFPAKRHAVEDKLRMVLALRSGKAN